MTAIIFDTLQYVKRAQAVGIKTEHAEFQAEELAKLVDNELATKKDLFVLEGSIKKDLSILKGTMKNELVLLEQRLLIKLGSLMIAGIGILGFILKH